MVFFDYCDDYNQRTVAEVLRRKILLDEAMAMLEERCDGVGFSSMELQERERLLSARSPVGDAATTKQ